MDKIAIRYGGAAGDGLQSTGLHFGKYINSLGYYFNGVPGNQSAIRGGHIWYHMEISSEKNPNVDNLIDILVALHQQALDVHLEEVRPGGIIIYNETARFSIQEYMEEIEAKNIIVLGIPLTAMAREVNVKLAVLANTVSIGALLEILNLQPEAYLKIVEERFKKESIVEMNRQALIKGYEFAKDHLELSINLTPPILKPKENIVVNGNHAIALGAVASGLKFVSQYPITPASSILAYLEAHVEDFGIVVRQVEDEIAAITMAVGAGWAGVRAMTATSGPGISLMAENIGLAGITETPVVIVDAQRGGPSTGVPTKTEQGDLMPIAYVSHGEFPRAIFAPRDIEEAYVLAHKAFNIAEKYQIPVFILSDFTLSERLENVKEFDITLKIDRGKLLDKNQRYPDYHRYAFTEDGISPRLLAPHPDGKHVGVGAEHDIDSNSLAGSQAGLYKERWMKEKMFKKRFRKMKVLEENDMDAPVWDGPENADISFITWGSVTTAVRDTIKYLNAKSSELKFNLLSFSNMFPLPVKRVKVELAKIRTGIIIEANYTGQLEQLLKLYTGYSPNGHLRHIDGEVMTKTRILTYLKEQEIEEGPIEYSYIKRTKDYNKKEVM